MTMAKTTTRITSSARGFTGGPDCRRKPEPGVTRDRGPVATGTHPEIGNADQKGCQHEDEVRRPCGTQGNFLRGASFRTWRGSEALPRRTQPHLPTDNLHRSGICEFARIVTGG